MTGPLVALVLTVGVLTAAALVWVALLGLNPGALVVRRSAERPAPVLSGRLVPSHRALPGSPPAAGTAAPVYRITDARERRQ